MVTLVKMQSKLLFPGKSVQAALNIVQAPRTVQSRFPGAEQVQVRTVDEQDGYSQASAFLVQFLIELLKAKSKNKAQKSAIVGRIGVFVQPMT
jgi:hypothetical protein